MAQPLPTSQRAPRRIRLVLEVEEPHEHLLLDEDDIPETPLHDHAIVLLQLLLQAWAARTGRDALVARNLACRCDPSDARIGIDPDIALIDPAPPGGEQLASLRIWEPGHVPPRVGVEVVSKSTAEKDYQDAPTHYAVLGVRELWVFDPALHGPALHGGPHRLQVWRQGPDGEMERRHAGAGPAWSEELQAWLQVTDDGTRLRLSDDRAGKKMWRTEAEEHALARQAAEEREHDEARARRAVEKSHQREQERAEAAEREVAELRRQLEELRRRG